jgi:hypothetical protein
VGHMWPIKRDSQKVKILAIKPTNLMKSPHLTKEMKSIFALFILFSFLVSFHDSSLWNILISIT